MRAARETPLLSVQMRNTLRTESDAGEVLTLQLTNHQVNLALGLRPTARLELSIANESSAFKRLSRGKTYLVKIFEERQD